LAQKLSAKAPNKNLGICLSAPNKKLTGFVGLTR
jgi:hypothetical protein